MKARKKFEFYFYKISNIFLKQISRDKQEKGLMESKFKAF